MKNKTNLLLDIGVFAAFLIALEPGLTGIAIHEWLSIHRNLEDPSIIKFYFSNAPALLP